MKILEKRAQYIGRSLEVRETFTFASPVEVPGAIQAYGSSYGCLACLDLGVTRAAQLVNCWTTNVKLTWSVPIISYIKFSLQLPIQVLEYLYNVYLGLYTYS